MKRTNLIPTILLAITTSSFSFGQIAHTSFRIEPGSVYEFLNIAEETVTVSEESDRAALENMKLTNMKVYKKFTKSFKNVADIKVTNKKDATFIYCKDAGIVTRVAYNKNGNWLNTMRSLLADQIPSRVSELVQEEFPRHKINGANEIHALDKIAFLVYIEDSKGFKTIRVIEGEWDVYEEFNK
ncbi:MAG: hypothetical protein ACXWV5_07630 [Flavitalea sp.]